MASILRFYSGSYSDQDIYTMFDLSQDEIVHIENKTKDFPMFKAKNSLKKESAK